MRAPASLSATPATTTLARSLVASLPLSYRLVQGAADVAVIPGDAAWPAAATAATGHAATVVVIDPVAVSPPAADAAGQVVISETFAGNPAIAALPGIPVAAAAIATASSVTSLSTGRGTVRRQIFEQVRVLRALGLGEPTVMDSQLAAHSALITLSCVTSTGTILIRLQAAQTSAAPREHTFRWYGSDHVLSIRLPDSVTAQPASVQLLDPQAQTVLPTIYETAHRATLRSLGTRDRPDLTDFAHDVALIGSLG
ncbi:MAG: hypothetical protein ACK5H2_09160 [Beutenbergiaceae bacterium]